MSQAFLLQVKSFGDLVIAKIAVDRVCDNDRQRLAIICAPHLQHLCAAIQPQVAVVLLQTGESDVPSLFDIRKNGIRAAAISAVRLRRALARAPIARDALILADRVGSRERFVLGGRSTDAIAPDARNIYAGYAQLLAAHGFPPAEPVSHFSRSRRVAGLFPGSRLAKKNLPEMLVRDLVLTTHEAGWKCEVVVLAGERPDLEASDLPVRIVRRSFVEMCDAVAASDVVISADSLPAHLAEMLGRKVFVFSPEPNEFWMPASAWRTRQWSLFNDRAGPRAMTALLLD